MCPMKALTNRRIVKVKEMEGQSYDNSFKKGKNHESFNFSACHY